MRLFGFGANSSGQLGMGFDSEHQSPAELNLDFLSSSKIKFLCCGASHTLIIDENGDIWAAGKNNRGQLGDGTTANKNKFVKISVPMKFQEVCCGWVCSAAFTTDSRLFLWGSNMHNQLGFNSSSKLFVAPEELTLPAEWGKPIKLKFGLKFAVILTDNNRIFITGSLKAFQNSPNCRMLTHNSCEYLALVSEVKDFACGQNHVIFSCPHSSTIFGIGENKFNQCGERKVKDSVKSILSGWTHCCVLTKNGKLFLWGRNSYGQLGNGIKDNQPCNNNSMQKISIERIDDVSLGSEHGILLAENKVFTWGWNEHGNCGTGDFEDV